MVDFFRRYAGNHAAIASVVVLAIFVGLAVFGDRLATTDPMTIVARPLLEPSAEHPFGTDALGRDVMSGVLVGAKASLVVGVAAAAVSLVIGVLIGGIAGYYRGPIDVWLMRATELVQVYPGFVLALVLVAVFSPTFINMVLAISVVSWPTTARLVRAEFLSLREQEFVVASRAVGAGDGRLILLHILPNALPPVIVYASLTVGTAILIESALSFLGLGDPDQMSWGYMIGASRSFLRRAWWTAFFPGLAIVLVVLSLNLAGDGLNDALNSPRKGRE
jgi:peptide/nickel transport system permease protein